MLKERAKALQQMGYNTLQHVKTMQDVRSSGDMRHKVDKHVYCYWKGADEYRVVIETKRNDQPTIAQLSAICAGCTDNLTMKRLYHVNQYR